jgi:hypothetical protein
MYQTSAARLAAVCCLLMSFMVTIDPPGASSQGSAPTRPEVNVLTPEERAAGWRLLFDGRTTEGWRGYKSDGMPAGWRAVDGALTRVASGGDIVTREKFKNFELALEWNVAPGGNSGIFYRASEDDEAIYWTAPEMQVLDDAAHRDGGDRMTSAGALYGLYPAAPGVVKPAGEWNQVRVVVNGNHVEHWLNGTKTVECEIGSADWEARVAASKFAPHVKFARNAEGHIGLQDHGDRVAFRNIKIRELK